NPDSFAFCNQYDKITYKAGIYKWANKSRPVYQMMDPLPPPVFLIPGMKVGCVPYDAILNSTLECFFSSLCLNTTAQWISTLPSSSWPKPLDSSKLINFLPNSSVASIMDGHMFEELKYKMNFTGYYNACAPSECMRTYTYRNSFFYAIKVLLSLYGGLTVALRSIAPMIVWLGSKVYGKCLKKAISLLQKIQSVECMF
ncbi:unnamed protein product, partial [Rotaria sp. Silwood1]